MFIPPALFYFQIVHLFRILDVTFDYCQHTDAGFLMGQFKFNFPGITPSHYFKYFYCFKLILFHFFFYCCCPFTILLVCRLLPLFLQFILNDTSEGGSSLYNCLFSCGKAFIVIIFSATSVSKKCFGSYMAVIYGKYAKCCTTKL